MSNEGLWRLGAAEVARGIREKQFSSREVVSACLDRAEATHEQLNALSEIRPEAALKAADAADRAVATVVAGVCGGRLGWCGD